MKTTFRPLHLALLAALAAAPLFSGCSTAPAPVVAAEEAVAKPRPKIVETIVLLPTADGKSSGAVEIRVDGHKQLLDEPYETAMVATGEKIGTRFSNAEEVQEIAGEALQSLPIKPVSFTLLFAIDSDKLPADAAATIERIVEEIGKRQVPDVSIVGHTDRSGNARANFALSQRRANNVHRQILDQGIETDDVRIEVVGKGDSENAVVNPQRKFEKRNRRVEVFVR